jgi:NAD(P)-dependent dehydrogenase (short-subunit alcohol dehydrogenase family)/acyl carrier protein
MTTNIALPRLTNLDEPPNLAALVVSTMAELTRYPAEILVPSAHLEEDLGIDSVKRAEIVTVLGQRLGIEPGDDTFVRNVEVPRTVADLIALAERTVAHERPPAAATIVAPPIVTSPVVAPPITPAPRNFREEVIDVVAELTRYPREILTDNADLDEELGIDSVKRAEILSTLAQRLSLTMPADPAAFAMPRTVGDLIALGERLSVAPAPEPVRLLRPVPVPPPPAAQKTSFTNPSTPLNRGVSTPPAAEAPRSTFTPAALLGANPRLFEGKVALVTGSGHGLGKVLAKQLAELGATVIVNSFYSRNRADETTAEINAAGGKAVHLWGSVANSAHLEKLFDDIDQRFGHLDFFVQNASNGVIGPLDQITEEHWDRAFRTNVVGFHRAALLAAKLMKRRGGGRIVALSSPGAQRYIEYFGCLGPVKAAVESLGRYLAVELGRDNIQVNVVSAGPVYGERLTNYPDAGRLIPYWETLSPDGRLGEADEITAGVLYLLSPAAHKINGAVLLIDGAASQKM